MKKRYASNTKSEVQIEQHLCKQVKALGGKAYKFISPGNNGVPDRIVLLPGGEIFFVELKALGKTPTPKQLAEHEKLRNLGFLVFVVDSYAAVDTFIAQKRLSSI